MNAKKKKSILLRFGVKKLARATGKSDQSIYKYAAGTRKIPSDVCYKIERATNGAVTRKDLRDDWADIWPELK